uniref:Uncharacterized protein LOC111115991 n=1 Tax=Crassostrea virginica TaxID=6565 RepID=A0A8B8C730_CRAVI|nr:uncharacterized protein LOC111115991 [Crassostrea virginica]
MKLVALSLTLCAFFHTSYSQYTIVDENGSPVGLSGCPTPGAEALGECTKPRARCCYVDPEFDAKGCFTGCTTTCFINKDPTTCNICANPQVGSCMNKPLNCGLGVLSFNSFDSTYSCFQGCYPNCK